MVSHMQDLDVSDVPQQTPNYHNTDIPIKLIDFVSSFQADAQRGPEL